MKNNLKRFFCYCGVLLVSLVIVFATSFSTFALRINDNVSSPKNLALIWQFNEALETCMDGSLSDFYYDYSGGGEYKLQNIQRSYDTLLAKKYFFNEYSGPLIYSREFERDVSQGSYQGGIFGSGNSDGKMYCGENNDAVFHKAMQYFGVSETEENLKELYCDGSNPGIYKIKATKYDGNSNVIEEDWNCGNNFDKFVRYAKNNITDPEYSLHVYPSDDPVLYYIQWFKKKVGSFDILTAEQNTAMFYAKAVHDFQTLCSPSGPFATSPGSKSEVKIYDAFSGKASSPSVPVYYTIGVGSGDKFYTEISNKTEKTCAEIAAEITKDGAEAYAGAPIKPIDDGKESDVKDCYNTSKDNLKTLKTVRNAVKAISLYAEELLNQAESFRSNGYKANEPEYLYDAWDINQEYGYPVGGNEFAGETLNYPERMMEKVEQAGGGAALSDFVAFAEDFLNSMVSFRERSDESGLTDDEKIDFDARVDNYKTNFEKFKTDILDKIVAIYNNAEAFANVDLNSMYVTGQPMAGKSTIKDSVEGFYSFDSNNRITCSLNIGINDYKNQIQSITGGDIEIEAFVAPTHDYPTSSDLDINPAGENDVCYDNSGSLGWIICPIITAADGVGEYMWHQIEEYHLKIPASKVFESGGGVEKGWGIIRTFANFVFIILLLFVIFSQITGIGIDNYGIKKILPRLIMIAVLVNLSYLICQLAVDLSNILGVGLNNLLSGLVPDINSAATGASGASQAGAWALTAILGTGGVLLFATLQAGSFTGGLVWIGLAVLGIVIIIVFAMLVLYLILVAREAGIVLSIVIAPVAIVCYALPNTEKLAKKWFNLFKALMIVYPICGAMVGGGQLAGSILASIDNSGMKVAAMIVQVLPFFLVPMLLKNSLALMGNVGAKLSSFGRSIGRRSSAGAKGLVKNNDRFKDWSQFQKDRSMERSALRTKARLDRRSNGGISANLSDRQRMRLSRANEIIRESEGRRQQADIGARNDVHQAEMTKQHFQNEEAMADTLMYDTAYVAGKHEQGNLQREENHDSALMYQNGAYLAGKRAQTRLRQENEREGTVLYTRPGFEQSRRNQYTAQRQSEVRKMYSDQYANLDKASRQTALSTALSGSGVDAVEQADAAFDSLTATGDMRELLDAFHGASFTTMDADVRSRMVAKAAASGNQLLKGWAKTNGTVNLQDYIDNGGLSGYLSSKAGEHAFDSADKDTLSFLADHNGAQAMSAATIANLATTAANANQDATSAAVKLIGGSGRQADIGAAINADALTRMNVAVANALGAANLSGAVADINRSGNESLRAKVSTPVKTMLGIS